MRDVLHMRRLGAPALRALVPIAALAAAGVVALAAASARADGPEPDRPDTAGDLGRGAGAFLGGVLRITPVLGQGLDAVDGQRAKLKRRRARRAAEREAERVRGMQFAQCVADPCLYGAICPQLFPHFIVPACAAPAAASPVPPPRPAEPPDDPDPPAADRPASSAGTFRPVPPETACLIGRTHCGPNCAEPVTAADRAFCREVNNRRLLGGFAAGKGL